MTRVLLSTGVVLSQMIKGKTFEEPLQDSLKFKDLLYCILYFQAKLQDQITA